METDRLAAMLVSGDPDQGRQAVELVRTMPELQAPLCAQLVDAVARSTDLPPLSGGDRRLLRRHFGRFLLGALAQVDDRLGALCDQLRPALDRAPVDLSRALDDFEASAPPKLHALGQLAVRAIAHRPAPLRGECLERHLVDFQVQEAVNAAWARTRAELQGSELPRAQRRRIAASAEKLARDEIRPAAWRTLRGGLQRAALAMLAERFR